ncbi:lysozyme [Temperatibacter marinus]|uniref:Lysozyme n=1 Tax=Temperatibacter marinus TaxID=1456591 RepID=A0AA52EJN9_9PROT|nr:lysozyme [Temperatibacter marinus]WND04030.1 lysozyme [Temperatibacter marinus]
MKTSVNSFNGFLLRPIEKLFLSIKGEDFIKNWEGFAAFPYEDIAGHCTIGYGEKLHDGHCTLNDTKEYLDGISQSKASKRLAMSVGRSVTSVGKWLKGAWITQSMFDALVSLTFNTGGNQGNWQVYKRTASGQYRDAAFQFLDINLAYNPATKKKEASAGLTKRRIAEKEMYLYASYSKP